MMLFLYKINSPCVKEERGPDPVELVRGVSLSEGEQPAHVVHAAHLKTSRVKYFDILKNI